jgi:hypothetical protein
MISVIHWDTYYYVYVDGRLRLTTMDSVNLPLLRLLGWACTQLDPLPIRLPPEFELTIVGYFRPPDDLATLVNQIEAWQSRLKSERIAALEQELCLLKV